MTEEMIRPMTLVDYEDPESHVPVKACSPDNGRTVKIYFTPWGIVWHADDVEVLWNDFLLDKVKSVMSVSWDQIQGKPVLVTKGELDQRLSNLDIPSTDGLAKQADLDSVKATADSAESKAEQAQSTADANTKTLQNVYTKEESDQKYWTAEQERDAESNLNTNIQELIDDKANADDVYTKSEIDSQNASNVKSVNNIEPDAQGNVNIDLTGYVKQDELPKSMSWSQITDKPSLALSSDIPSLDGYAKLTDIPSVTGLVKETELADYAKKSDLPTMPDLSGYATVSSLIDYAKKSDLPDFSKYALKNELPITMAWQNITGKPDLATQDDLKNIELKPGPQGEPGTPGKDGVTPHIDSTTGDWFIGNQDTGTQAQGPAGKNGRDGADGQPGKDGQNGITPHIDTATGNWFVGSTDTGIKAQGPQGIQGVPGKDGRNGIDGKDGDRGPQGIPGEQGEPGVPGTNGKDGKSAYQIWLDNGHSGTETDFLNSLKGKDGTDVDLSGYATTEAVQKAQSTADNAYKYSQNEASLINKRIDNIKVPTESDFNRVKTITSGTLAGLASAQGSYHYEIDFVPSDGPASDWGLLDVVVGEHYAKQVFTNTGATGDNLGNVYIRTRGYGSTSWSDWREITLWQ